MMAAAWLCWLQVRRWNTETGANVDSYNGSKAILTVASSAEQPALVAFGGSDSVVRLWDTRGGNGEALAVKAFSPHSGRHSWASKLGVLTPVNLFAPPQGRSCRVLPPHRARPHAPHPLICRVLLCPGWVSSVSWSAFSSHHVASASHDGSVKVWDVRSNIPLGTQKAAHGGNKVNQTAWPLLLLLLLLLLHAALSVPGAHVAILPCSATPHPPPDRKGSAPHITRTAPHITRTAPHQTIPHHLVVPEALLGHACTHPLHLDDACTCTSC